MKRVCSRCLTPVEKSEVDGYPFYCKNHDEDLYGIETIPEEFNPYKKKDVDQEKEMEDRLEFGVPMAHPISSSRTCIWGLFVGKEYSRSHGLDAETKFVTNVQVDAIKAKDHEKYDLKHNGKELVMYACLERVFYCLGEAVEFVKLLLRNFPSCYGTAEAREKI